MFITCVENKKGTKRVPFYKVSCSSATVCRLTRITSDYTVISFQVTNKSRSKWNH